VAAQTGGYPFYLVPGETCRKMYEVIKAVIQVYQSRAQKIEGFVNFFRSSKVQTHLWFGGDFDWSLVRWWF
jgi:hypothetical protein